jgi:hypothetical protein
VVPLIVAPFAFEVPEIAPIELNPAFAAVIEAFTYSVVATLVELSLVAGVGAVGVPVNVGELIGAFNKISAVFPVILAVFEITLVSNAASALVALVTSAVMLAVLEVILVSNAASALVALVISAVILAVFVFTLVVNELILFVFAVMLAVFEVILVSNAASALVALVISAVMLAVFAFTLVVNELILFVFAVMLTVFAFTLVGKVAMVLELTPPTLFTVVAN